jgi:hypothetical protein
MRKRIGFVVRLGNVGFPAQACNFVRFAKENAHARAVALDPFDDLHRGRHGRARRR